MRENQLVNHTIDIQNRNRVIISGVTKVQSTSPTHFNCNIDNLNLSIDGSDITVQKLDVVQGNVELSGTFDCIKYVGAKKPFLQRLFK